MANRPLTRKEWMEYLEKACEEFDWKGAGQREWQGLTDEERNNLWRDVIGWGDPSHDDEDLMKALEAKLRERNT